MQRVVREVEDGGDIAKRTVSGPPAGGGFAGPGGEKGDHVVVRDSLDRGDRLRRWRRSGPDWPDAPGGNYSSRRVRLEDEGFDPAPQLVLVRLAPDPAHLGQRVTLDHGLILPQPDRG